MGCNCGGNRTIDPATGRMTTSHRRVADGNDGKGWEYVDPSGTVSHHPTKHAANVAKVTAGGGGSIRPAS